MADDERLQSIKHIILVMSGKGGVGKSSIATQIALTLKEQGKIIGLLDIDICGPSIPKMLGLKGQSIVQSTAGWVPIFATPDQQLKVMSIAFLAEHEDDPVIFRGPKKSAMIKHFLVDTAWGDLDYLIIDTPPGSSDEHISIVENLRSYKPDGAVIVTTSQMVALADVRKELKFCEKAGLRVLGIVENMSGYVCPHCSECTNVFSSGGGSQLADLFNVPFLGCVPLDPKLTESLDNGQSFLLAYPESKAKQAIDNIVKPLADLPDRHQ